MITSTSHATATGMSCMLHISHDRVTRSLSRGVYDSKYLWKYVKPYVQEMAGSSETIVLSIDDSVEEKSYAVQIFKNGDGTVGTLYLACIDVTLSFEQINTIYKKRWGVEEYHTSVKSNVGFARSPTKTAGTRSNEQPLKRFRYHLCQ